MIMIFQASDVLLDLAADERSSNDRKSDFIVDNNMDGTGFLVDYGRNDSVSVGIVFFHYCFQIYSAFNI
jgi:hypothetical protein